MKCLLDIKEYVQSIAEVIESVVSVDVTIVDVNKIRVAATGRYRDKVGLSSIDKSVFMKAIENKESYIVNNPRYEPVCLDCECKENCIEYAEVCCPIIVNDQTLGVIGLVALTEEQKEKLINNEQNLLKFLKRMGDLLETKILEADARETEKIILKQIETIIDSIDDGLIAINHLKNVIFTNKRFQSISQKSRIDDFIDRIIENINISEILTTNCDIFNKRVTLKDNSYFVTSKRIILETKIIGFVIIIRTIYEINKIINDISNQGSMTYFEDIIGLSSEIKEVKSLSQRTAAGDSTVLIMGESGTGKEMFARAIHSASSRKDKPFIAINCAAIPENLLESELFGYEEGSFTGARKGGKVGKFELGNGGTIFLDEIGDMPLHLQTKLLRVLQERVIEKVGASFCIHVDIRIISATNKDIYSMVEQGEFRRDLFYRLNVIPIRIPPLRDRKSDIKILMDHFLKKCNEKLIKNIGDFDKEVYDCFDLYNWPGNIREMENVIEYAVNMELSNIISIRSLPARFREASYKENQFNLKEIEKKIIEEALNKIKNKDKAAKVLGIGRATLFRKIKEYEIKVSE